MSRMSVAERFGRTVDLSDREAKRNEKALRSLKQGASIARASMTAGCSVSTLYRHGVVRRYREWLSRRSASQDPPSPERR